MESDVASLRRQLQAFNFRLCPTLAERMHASRVSKARPDSVGLSVSKWGVYLGALFLAQHDPSKSRSFCTTPPLQAVLLCRLAFPSQPRRLQSCHTNYMPKYLQADRSDKHQIARDLAPFPS